MCLLTARVSGGTPKLEFPALGRLFDCSEKPLPDFTVRNRNPGSSAALFTRDLFRRPGLTERALVYGLPEYGAFVSSTRRKMRDKCDYRAAKYGSVRMLRFL